MAQIDMQFETEAAEADQSADMEFVVCNLCGRTDSFDERFPDTRPADYDGSQFSAYLCTHPGYGIHPPIVECPDCGLLFTNPRPTSESISQNYTDVEDDVYLEEESAREATFRRRLRWLERHSGPGNGRRILDIGAYTGVFVDVAQQAGWDAWGLEPSRWAAKFASERGLNVTQGLVQAHPFEPASFDAVTLWDVIEHVTDPAEVLAECYTLLKPGGWIAVHTMDIDSLFAKVMGSRWPWLMEMHIYYFTKKTLAETIEKAGFEVANVQAEGRYLRLKYLLSRLQSYSMPLYQLANKGTSMLGMSKMNVPLNFGDLVTAYAQKPHTRT